MTSNDSPPELRLSSTLRGFIIAALIAGYAWFSKQPGTSLAASMLVAAGLQLAVVVIRRLVPPDRQPQAIYIFEMLADGVSVLLFALGVFGGILKTATDA